MVRFWILILILKFRLVVSDLTKEQIDNQFDLPPKGFGNFVAKIRVLEKCSDLGVTIDPDNNHETYFRVLKYNEIDEGVSGYLITRNYYRVTKAKITPFTPRNGVMVMSFNHTTTTPCEHPILSIPLKMFFSPDSKCGFKKNNYTVTNFNMNKYAHLIAGDNFIYVRTYGTLEYFSDVGRTFCYYAVIDLRPIPKIKKKKNPLLRKSTSKN